jgi:polyphenol oxidase
MTIDPFEVVKSMCLQPTEWHVLTMIMRPEVVLSGPISTNARISQSLGRQPGVAHGFFTRQGGVSSGLHASLNCGLGSNDSREYVLENRRRVAAHLGAPDSPLLTAYQVHSAEAVIVDRPWAPDAQPRADALVTKTEGLILGTLTADCAPVLLVDPSARVIASVHAGWKGAFGGIVDATLVAMEQLGAHRQDIAAAVGPCIGKRAYEVGTDFRATFIASDPSWARYFEETTAGTRPYFDLPDFVADRLRHAGCGSVEVVQCCTYENEVDFFSYRRTTHRREPDYGRQISAIVLRKQ